MAKKKPKNSAEYWKEKYEMEVWWNKETLNSLLLDPEIRDFKAMHFFISSGNIMPLGDIQSFAYGAKKYHDFLELKIEEILKR